MRLLQPLVVGYRLYTRLIPWRRGRGLFTRAVHVGVALGLQRPVVRTQFGFGMEFEQSLVGRTVALEGIWEPGQSRLLWQHLRPGDTVLNIGSNTGYYTLLAATAVGPGGRVYAFDIQAEMCESLRRNCLLNSLSNVAVINAGCWSGSGTGAVVSTRDMDPGEVHLRVDGRDEGRKVNLVTIDGFVRENDLRRVDMLIIDTEGADYEVLRGASWTIQQFRPAIMLEVHHLTRFGTSEEEVLRFLSGHDYRITPCASQYSRDWFCLREPSSCASR